MSIFSLKQYRKELGLAALVFLGWTNTFEEFGFVKVHYYGIAEPVVYFIIVMGVKHMKCRMSS